MSEKRPLEGYKILDLSRFLPGPYCSMILGDLGMEVLKLEEPKRGDPARGVGPRRARDSVYFLAVNRNKRSIAIDLGKERGKEIFRRLCQGCDVVLENFSPGTMDRLGLGYTEISKVNPSIIFCSISGFGQTGHYRDKPGHDINYLALSGLLGMTDDEHSRPAIPGILISDLTAGLFASIGILAALLQRKETGKGRFIDLSMMDGVMSLLCYHIAKFGLEKKRVHRGEMEFTGGLPCYNIYETLDHRYMALGAIEPSFWKNFLTLIGHREWMDKQWAAGPENKMISSELKAIFKTKTQKEWVEYLEDKRVCCEPVLEIDEVFANPQVLHRQMILEMDHPTEGRLYQAGNPIKLSGMKEAYEPPPQFGEHTEAVLTDLGYGCLDIASFKKDGVI